MHLLLDEKYPKAVYITSQKIVAIHNDVSSWCVNETTTSIPMLKLSE